MALSDNIWWTRRARIQTEARLLSNAFQAQLLLLWYSFCSVAASIYYLKLNTQSEYSDVAWVIFSVLVLCVSGFINGLSFKERAGLVKENYEQLHSLYQKSKSKTGDDPLLTNEYEEILNGSENHTDRDYYMALCIAWLSTTNPGKNLDRRPTKYIWLLFFFYWVRWMTLLGSLYFLPLMIFYFMEK